MYSDIFVEKIMKYELYRYARMKRKEYLRRRETKTKRWAWNVYENDSEDEGQQLLPKLYKSLL